jgi:hypothetical protein
MPVTGRKPKPAGQALNRNKPVHDWTEVVDVPFEGAPKLPAKQPNGRTWSAWTKAWWVAVSTMPHCVLWSSGDWRFAIETALVAAEWHDGRLGAATELRNREKVLGTTVDFRRDLRIRYVAPEPTSGVDAEVTVLADYRDL